MCNCYDSAKQNWELTNKHGVATPATNGDKTPRTAMRSNQDLGFQAMIDWISTGESNSDRVTRMMCTETLLSRTSGAQITSFH
jgi:ribosomal protein S16